MTGLVYLSGPISGLTHDQCDEWRQYVRERLAPGVVSVSPMRGKDSLRNAGKLGEHPDVLGCDSRAITQRDRWDVMRCDAMIVNLQGAEDFTVGTLIELGWADMARRPIILVSDPGNVTKEEHAMANHPIVNGIIGWRVPNLDQAIWLVNTMLATPEVPSCTYDECLE